MGKIGALTGNRGGRSFQKKRREEENIALRMSEKAIRKYAIIY